MNSNCVANIKMYESLDMLSEIGQTMAVKYSFINKELEQVHTPVICRDFLHDIVRTNLTGDPANIYGLHYNTKKHKGINLDRLVMLLEFPKGFIPNTVSIMKCLHIIEGHMGLFEKNMHTYPTFVLNVSNLNILTGKKHVLLSSPGKWMSSPALLSLYTLLIKVSQHMEADDIPTSSGDNPHDYGFQYKELKKEMENIIKRDHKEGCINSQYKRPMEVGYLKSIIGKLDVFVKEYENIVKLEKDGFDSLYYKDLRINSFHELGITGLLEGHTKCGASKQINEILIKDKKRSKKIQITGSVLDLKDRLSIRASRVMMDKISMALIKKEVVEDKPERVIVTTLENSGTALICHVGKLIESKNNGRKDDIDLSKTRLLCVFDDVHKIHEAPRKLKFVKRLINVIESKVMEKQEYKKDKMIVAEADITFREYGGLTSFLFTGSGKWVSSPYLFFILTLFIQTLSFASIEELITERNIKTIEDIKNVIKEIMEKNPGIIPGVTLIEKRNLLYAVENIDFIINNFNALHAEDYVKSYNTFCRTPVNNVIEIKNKEMTVGGNSK